MSAPALAVLLARPILWFSFYAVGGWCWETIYCSIAKQHFVKRGFLFGPLCPIYGVGALLVWLTLSWISSWTVMFFAGALIASAVEYATGWALEQLFHQRWWSYDGWLLNLQGRVCLVSALVFGAFTLLVNLGLQPFVISLCDQLTASQQILVASIISALMLIDFTASTLRHGLEAGNRRALYLLRALRR
jgi:uncharacterized membrane protein